METAPILRARNATFVDGFSAGDLPLPPRLDLVVVSCFDPRVDPGTYWGLGLGDAFVIRSVGGRVTDQVIMSVGMIHSLVRSVQGRSVPLEVAVVHHTECGAVRLADPAVRAELSATLAVEA